MSLNGLDAAVLRLFSSWVAEHCGVDGLMSFVSASILLKGAAVVALLWYLWFRPRPPEEERWVRRGALATLASCLLAVMVGRSLVAFLPFRLRPLHRESLEYPLACGLGRDVLEGWSSFPSDHAVMFFSLATGLFLVSRWAGLLALAHAIFVISLPRVYLGFHYPSDILSGALLGSALTLLVFKTPLSSLAWRLGERLLRVRRGLFYAGFFLLSLELALMFGGSRALLAYLTEVVRY